MRKRQKKAAEFDIQALDPAKQQERLQHLHMLRQKAYRVMLLLKPFSPKLTGMVLDGSALRHTHIRLHVFTTPEEIIMHLVNNNIPYDEGEQRVQLMDRSMVSFPMFSFYLADTAIEVTVFPEDSIKYQVRCPSTGQRMSRAGLPEVEKLI